VSAATGQPARAPNAHTRAHTHTLQPPTTNHTCTQHTHTHVHTQYTLQSAQRRELLQESGRIHYLGRSVEHILGRCLLLYTHIHTHVYTRVYLCACESLGVREIMNIYAAHIHIHAQAHIHTHTHTHAHTRTRTRTHAPWHILQYFAVPHSCHPQSQTQPLP